MIHKRKEIFEYKQIALIIALFILIPVGNINASDKDGKLTNHVIIAFDDAFSTQKYKDALVYNRYYRDNCACVKNKKSGKNVELDERKQVDSLYGSVSEVIRKIIDENGLLKKGDYFSIVNFCMGTGNCSFDDFVKSSEFLGFYENDGIAAWCSYKSMDSLFPDKHQQWKWKDVVYFQGYNRAKPSEKDSLNNKNYRFSLLMGAKQYALKVLKADNLRTNKVYLLMVTDDQYNGNDDIYSEINQLNNPCVSKDEFVRNCREVSTYFKFEFVKEEIICNKGYDAGKDYKVMLLEVVPCYSTSLNSVIDYPASMGLHRVKGGYNICFDYRGVDSMFHVEKLAFTVRKDNKVIGAVTNGRDGDSIKLELKEVFPGDDIDVEMSCWLSMEDPVYNGFLMSPDDERYSRLKTSRKIKLTDQARVIGLPLKDGFWWFCQKDSIKAASIWSGIIAGVLLCIAVGLVILIIRRVIKKSVKYVPKDADIKINTI